MNKSFIISLFIVLFLGLSLVSAVDLTSLSISPTPVSIVGLPGETKTVNVQFTNNVGSTLNLNILKVDLAGQLNPAKKILASQVTVNPTIFTLTNGQSQTVVISLTIPTGLNADTYKGTFSVSDSANTKNFDVLVNIGSVPNFEILTYTDTNPLTITGQEDSSINGKFSIKNIGSTPLTFDLTSYDITGLDLSDDKRTITLTFPSTTTVEPGETKDIVINGNVPSNMQVDTYDGILKVTSNSVQKSFKLEIKIHPELCKDGIIGDFTLDIDDPDSGDEFAPGETINIKVNVGNDFDKNINDVMVTAFLYDVDEDDKVEEVDSDTDDIDKNDDVNFDLDLEVPIDVQAGDEFILFVKGFEDGNEDEHCAEGQLSIDITREKHDVIIPTNGINILPTQTVKQGESFDVTVKVINVGSSNEDGVTVKLSIPDLKISETSESFDLDDGESNDNEQIFRFANLKVPSDAKVKTGYSIDATVVFDDGDATNSGFGKLDVVENEEVITQPEDVLRVQASTETTVGSFTVSTILTNSLDESTTYTIEGSASWANLVSPQIIALKGGESKPVQLIFVGKEGLEAGTYNGNLIVKDNKGVIIESESFTVTTEGTKTVEPVGITGFSIFEGISGSTVLFIIGDIVLVIIAIFFIRMIFTSGKRKRDNIMMPPPGKMEKVKL